jgi:spore germination cell wall hydrolase CwlJ-like protein
MKNAITNKVKWYLFVPLVFLSLLLANGNIYNPPAREHKRVDFAQVKCLATSIFFEAKGEPLSGQAAVARVVMNRVKHGFASTPCKVVYQTTMRERSDGLVKLCQFSWVCEGKTKPNELDPRYIKALNIAFRVIADDAFKDVIPKNVLFFHSINVDPNWPYRKVSQIGNHIFYAKHHRKT